MCLGIAWCCKLHVRKYKEASPKSKALFWYIVAGFFFLSAFPSAATGDWPVFVITLLIAAGIALYGFRKNANSPHNVDDGEAPSTDNEN